ncbi:GIY-YIG nuclease family protein [Bacillus cereus group sp. RP43]|uniref:GIY-YIG nuclease family protein n=1 Tax=Bacillus cereus group sp. RP43 TaxID=3040260 RepID=UPI00339B4C6B
MGELNFMSLDEFNIDIHKSDSGVYLITDHDNKIVYVGKGLSIKHRVNAHFKGYSNIKEHSYLFNKVAYILEKSLLKRSLLEITYMIEYKTVLNKEVQDEFPDLYTTYIREKSRTYHNIPFVKNEAEEKRKREEVKKKEALKNKVVSIIGDKSLFYDIVSFLDNGYNPHILSSGLNIELEIIKYIQEHRGDYRIPKSHKRTIKANDLIYGVTGKRKVNSRLDHLL